MSRRRRWPMRRHVDEEVARELATHLDERAAELMAAGWGEEEARAEARRLFGDVAYVAERCAEITRSHERMTRRGEMMQGVWQDVRYGVRFLVGSPGFALLAVLTLALGIGANTAIFSVVHGVLLEPLPFEEPDRLLWVDEVAPNGNSMPVAWGNFIDWQRESKAYFAGIAAYGTASPTILGGGTPVQLPGATVSRDFWAVFPVQPVAGRLTVPEEHVEGAAAVLVVDAAFARDVLAAPDPASAVGRTVDVGGTIFEVVGVVPSGFDAPEGARHWSASERLEQGTSRTAHNWTVVGRLAQGVSPEAAERAMDALQARLATEVPADAQDYVGQEVRMVPLRDQLVGNVRRPLVILMGAAVFVLLVACTNLASTLLARGTARAQEMAVRSALGGTRARLTAQLMVESLLLAGLGAVAGLGLASLILRVLASLGGGAIPRLANVGLDGPVLFFTLVATILTAVAFGVLPALRHAGGGEAGVLRAGGRGSAGSRGRTWDLLVAAEVAMALVLLVGSGLLIRSFTAVVGQDAGFHADDVVVSPVSLSAGRYPTPSEQAAFWDGALERARALPGVEAAGVITPRPLSFFPHGRVLLDGMPDRYAQAGYVLASRGAFEALDIPLVEGRLFDERDGPGAPHVAVVSESFAEEYWPGESPIGRLVSGGGMDDLWDADPPVFGTVIGVVADVRYRSLEREPSPTVYWHYRQRPFRLRWGAALVVESATADPALVAGATGDLVRRLDPEIPVQVRYLDEVVGDSVTGRRFILFVLGGFALLALVLAGVGIYGVVSYTVARRTREMGVRLALGAEPGRVRRLVLEAAARPVVAGLALGLAGGVALSGLLDSLLYEVEATDAPTFVVVTLLLLGVGFVASWGPARRGTRVDPVVAMRAD